MAKIIYYIWPKEQSSSGKHQVTVKYRPDRRRKTDLDYPKAWFDPPGSWYDDKWNVHYDGTDHPCDSLDKCKKILSSLDGYEFDGKKYVKVETEFIEATGEPKFKY